MPLTKKQGSNKMSNQKHLETLKELFDLYFPLCVEKNHTCPHCLVSTSKDFDDDVLQLLINYGENLKIINKNIEIMDAPLISKNKMFVDEHEKALFEFNKLYDLILKKNLEFDDTNSQENIDQCNDEAGESLHPS